MPHLPTNPLLPPQGSPIYYRGPSLETGPQPAVIFFALSAQMSLFEDPFNQSVVRLNQEGIRVFSWDLPFHGPGLDPHEAIEHWAYEFVYNPFFVSNFLDVCQTNLNYLIKENLIHPEQLAVAGLSRGGFVATHLAARDPRIKIILGFSPLTKTQPLEELKSYPDLTFNHLELQSIAEHLVHKRLRFYIGNHDTRVSTDACYAFIQALTDVSFNQGIRSPAVELIIYPSIGHKGHGTPPAIFYDGANWIKQQLLI